MFNPQSLISRLRPHGRSLAFVSLAVVIGQFVLLSQHPLAIGGPDGSGYIQVAQHLFDSPAALIQPFRPPAYPLLLTLTGFFEGYNHFNLAVLAQAFLCIVAVFEIYILTWRVTRSQLCATIVGVFIGLDVYILSFERLIQSEAMSFFSVVTMMFVFERFARAPKFSTGIVLALVMYFSVMVRPFNIIFPVLLFALLGIRSVIIKEWKLQWKPLLVSAGLCFTLVGGYIGLNGALNGIWGLSYDPNITLLGKVLEYNMQYYPVSDPQLQLVQKDVLSLPPNSDPWSLLGKYPDKYNRQNGASALGAFARYIILHHPKAYLQHSLPDLWGTWQAPDNYYTPFGNHPYRSQPNAEPTTVLGLDGYELIWVGFMKTNDLPIWTTALIDLSVMLNFLFLLLPFLLIVIGIMAWRERLQFESFLLLTLVMVVVSGCLLGALGNYAEFNRTRYPVDWALIMVALIVITKMVALFLANTRTSIVAPDVGNAAMMPQPNQGAAVSLQAPSVDEPSIDATLKRPALTRNQLSLQPMSRGNPEISIVLPCLNEEEAIGSCIDRLAQVIHDQHLVAEILVVDNASTDRSAEIARAHGARVVYQPERGYGNAYIKGFAEALGTYIVMADADNTYDLSEIDAFVQPLRDGYDLVIGNRFVGRMTKGAMTWSHRYIGNPLLSGLLNLLFHTGVRDAHCGMRAFRRDALPKMRLRTGGMEFASEMVINAAKAGLRITQRGIAYHPRVGESKLHTLRDGWRHLRFMLLYSPTYLFLLPGSLLMLVGLIVLGLLAPGPLPLLGHSWDVHAMILASVMVLIGLQIISLGIFARIFSLTEEIDGEKDRLLLWFNRTFTLEGGLLLGVSIFLIGFGVDAYILVTWIMQRFGPINEVRPAIVATTLIAVGSQIFFASFFISNLQFRKSLHIEPQFSGNPLPETEDIPIASHANW